MKTKIILRSEEFTSFTSHYLESLWGKYFDIEWYDPGKTYGQSGTLFVVWWQNADDDYSKDLRDQGHKVVVDNLWEVSASRTDYYWLENSNWFWYNESLWWQSLGYHQYIPHKQYSKLAFMPISRVNHTRDQIVTKLTPVLDNFIWSYRDKKLPNDLDSTNNNYQRFFNPNWYDDTYFSTVVESQQQGPCYRPTEKIFKTCAYYHPFLLIGQHHTLKRLKQLGFETYNNIFDESYDDIIDFDLRLNAVIKNINNFDPVPYDAETQCRLQHNHDHFFDQPLVESCIVTEIIEPLLEHAES
jgi:hypothetical protein